MQRTARARLDETAELLRSLGHEVRVQDPDYGLLATTFLARYFHGIREDVLRMPHQERLERRTRGFGRLGLLWEPFVERARRDEAGHAKRIFAIFDEHDVLITPMTAQPPVDVMRWEGMGALRTAEGMGRVYPFAGTWNVLGNPAASVPAFLDGDGLPIAVQLVGRPNDEHTIVSLAAQIEAERPWSERPPIAA